MRFAVEDFWVAADGDDYAPAIMRAQQASATVFDGCTLMFQRRLYTCSQRIDIIRGGMRLEAAEGTASGAATAKSSPTPYAVPTLWWPTSGACGIEVHYPGTYPGRTYGSVVIASDATARGNDCNISGLALVGPGLADGFEGSVNDHAIIEHFSVDLDRCFIRGWRGHAILMNASATAAVPYLGNVNRSRIDPGVSVYNCGMPALFLAGGDANQCSIEAVNASSCGEDMPNRQDAYTSIAAGQEMRTFTVTSVVAGTETITVDGTACNFIVTGGMSISDVVAGMCASITTARAGNQRASQISATTGMVWSLDGATFAFSESSSQITTASVASATTSPTRVYCFGGSAQTLQQGDLCSMLWTGGGFYRGIIYSIDTTYGYAIVDFPFDTAGDLGTAISGSVAAWRVKLTPTQASGLQHIGRTINIYGAATSTNNGAFPITEVRAGYIGGATRGVSITVRHAVSGRRYWLEIQGQVVSLVSSSSSTTTLKGEIVSAITAAAISGVSAVSTGASTFDINHASEVVVRAGGSMRVSNWQDSGTFVYYTNASGSTDSAFAGQIRIAAPTVQGAPIETIYMVGRMTQFLDSSLIGATYYNNQADAGTLDSDAYVAYGGASKYDYCYTEGTMKSVMYPPATWTHGPMNVLPGGAGFPRASQPMAVPYLEGGYLADAKGSSFGRIGGSLVHSVFEWVHNSAQEATDILRLGREVAGTSAISLGYWEWVTGTSLGSLMLRMAHSANKRIGQGFMSIGQPGLFFNAGEASINAPGSSIPSGSGSVSKTITDGTAVMGYEEFRLNGGYLAHFVAQVRNITSATNGPPAVIFCGSHGIPTGTVGRAIVRNIQGNTNINGERQFTYAGATSVNIQDTSGTNVTGSGTNTAATGIIIIGQLRAYGYVAAGTTLTLSSGNWMKGDRFVNLAPVSGDAGEWVCTATGVGGAATWAVLSTVP